MIKFFIVFLWGFIVINNNVSGRKDSLSNHPVSSQYKRGLIYDTDRDNHCFDIDFNKGYADYLKDPFKASNNRGDWGKIIIVLIIQLIMLL